MKREAFIETQHFIFHIKTYIEVWPHDKKSAFDTLKCCVDNYLNNYASSDNISCRDIAEALVTFLRKEYPCRIIRVSVSDSKGCGFMLNTGL